MEALVIATIAALGWTFSKKPTPQSPTRVDEEPTLIPRGAPLNDESHPSTQLNAFSNEAIKRWNQSQFPERTGIIAPLYSSMKVQNSNDSVKQRTLEQFTGSDITWRKKKEVENLFKPTPQSIDFSGKEGNLPSYTNTTIEDALTQTQNSALPFEQIRVGPGIDVPLDVPAADGLHSMYRAMPVDGFAYKNKELTGAIVPGSAENQQQMVAPHVPYNHPPRVFDMSRRPLEKGRSGVTAPMVRSRHTSINPIYGTDPGNPVQCHVDGQEYYGNQYRAMSYDNASDMTRRDDRTAHGDMLGVGTNVSAIQKYPQSAPAPTERNIIESRSNGPGPARYRVDKERHNCTGMQLLKKAKRGDYVEADRMAGPSYPNAMRRAKFGPGQDDMYLSKMYTQRTKAMVEGYKPQGTLHKSPTTAPSAVRPGKKYGHENTYMDYSIAAANLEGNPYAVQNIRQ